MTTYDQKDLFTYVLRLGDSGLVLGQRLSEWVGKAPMLEEEMALANMALDLVGQVGYADAFTFLYSKRSGTAAAEIPDDLAADVKQQRFDRLLELQQKTSDDIWKGDLGSTLEVLVEGESKQGDGQLFGRSTWNRIVNFSGSSDLIGRLVKVHVTKVFKNSNVGELVD